MPDQRFIIVRSPAEPTHGLEGFDAWAKRLPNVEVKPRVEPDKVATEYLSQTRIMLAPSRYETYGLAALEAAGHGIPTVHVDIPHVREGIGEAAYLVPPLGTEETRHGLEVIEADYDTWSQRARSRVEAVMERQHTELAAWNEWLPNVRCRHPRS